MAFFDKADIAETLAVTQTSEIVALCLGYFLKSYFETKQEKIQELEEKKFGIIQEENERGE